MRTDLPQCLTCAVVLALLLAAAVTWAAPIFAPVTAGRAVVSFSDMGTYPSYTRAKEMCKNKGGILPADYAIQVQAQLTNAVKDNNLLCSVNSAGQWTSNCYGVYTAGFADGSDCSMLPRENFIPDPLQPGLWQQMCAYRWDVGLFNRFNNSDPQPGVKFHNSAWADLRSFTTATTPTATDMNKYERYMDDPSPANVYLSGPMNGFTDMIMWNASFQCTRNVGMACIAPHGNPYVALGVRQLSTGVVQAVRVDVAEAPGTTNIPFATTNYGLMCQWQGVEAGYYDSTAAPSPNMFVPGWRAETWAEKYWWVIFIIVAVVILIVIFAILGYCCCREREKEKAAEAPKRIRRLKSPALSPRESSANPLGKQRSRQVEIVDPAPAAPRSSWFGLRRRKSQPPPLDASGELEPPPALHARSRKRRRPDPDGAAGEPRKRKRRPRRDPVDGQEGDATEADPVEEQNAAEVSEVPETTEATKATEDHASVTAEPAKSSKASSTHSPPNLEDPTEPQAAPPAEAAEQPAVDTAEPVQRRLSDGAAPRSLSSAEKPASPAASPASPPKQAPVSKAASPPSQAAPAVRSSPAQPPEAVQRRLSAEGVPPSPESSKPSHPTQPPALPASPHQLQAPKPVSPPSPQVPQKPAKPPVHTPVATPVVQAVAPAQRRLSAQDVPSSPLSTDSSQPSAPAPAQPPLPPVPVKQQLPVPRSPSANPVPSQDSPTQRAVRRQPPPESNPFYSPSLQSTPSPLPASQPLTPQIRPACQPVATAPVSEAGVQSPCPVRTRAPQEQVTPAPKRTSPPSQPKAPTSVQPPQFAPAPDRRGSSEKSPVPKQAQPEPTKLPSSSDSFKMFGRVPTGPEHAQPDRYAQPGQLPPSTVRVVTERKPAQTTAPLAPVSTGPESARPDRRVRPGQLPPATAGVVTERKPAQTTAPLAPVSTGPESARPDRSARPGHLPPSTVRVVTERKPTQTTAPLAPVSTGPESARPDRRVRPGQLPPATAGVVTNREAPQTAPPQPAPQRPPPTEPPADSPRSDGLGVDMSDPYMLSRLLSGDRPLISMPVNVARPPTQPVLEPDNASDAASSEDPYQSFYEWLHRNPPNDRE